MNNNNTIVKEWNSQEYELGGTERRWIILFNFWKIFVDNDRRHRGVAAATQAYEVPVCYELRVVEHAADCRQIVIAC